MNLDRLTRIIFTIAFLNFATFVVGAAILGGDAINGHAEGGRYFLASKGHETEVSAAVFTYSFVHSISVFVTHPLAIIFGWLNAWKD